VLDRAGVKLDMKKLWKDMVHHDHGKDMTSVMYRVHGAPIFEADARLADACCCGCLRATDRGRDEAALRPAHHFC